ncbi:hypothetical protein KPH14_003161 [Odynerus spinipes]|uniref:Uncharacterized protein n=1 Tax=Odynerus spinipes TaxID=1348599 RepID=A0AAD9RXT6_9HYME|nr:hypothetical protein KPH14_003161 [Odynerus spinipes]
MLDNASKWMSSGSSRLLKAKSSPNISKMSPSSNKETNSRLKNASRSNESTPANSGNKTPSRITRSSSRTPGKGEQTTPNRIGSSPSVDLSKTRTPLSSRTRSRVTPENQTKATANLQKNDKKKPVKATVSSPSSCTILEDRTLLKKGLTYAPAKPPKKPEALRKNLSLDRSVSLLNVPEETRKVSSLAQPSNERNKKDETTKRRQSMNRSISMWSVQSASKMEVYGNQSRKSMLSNGALCSRPSKIPLLAGRAPSLGRSLADLSQVDRGGESTLFRVVKTNLDIETDLDRSMDERIYENCREAIGEPPLGKEETPLASSEAVPIGTNLEERAARLMAELDDEDDNDNDENHQIKERIKKETINSLDCVDGVVENNGTTKSREILENSMKLSEIDVNPKKMEETTIEKEGLGNIKELRCNWERQAKALQEAKQEIKKSAILKNEDRVETPESKRKVLLGKRAKEIEHLVNFFNCKNAESAPAHHDSRDPWIKSKSNVPSYSSIESNLKKNNTESKNASEYNNGYVSDGNCSEDSGHISNENDIEWKDGGQSEQLRGSFDKERGSFFEEIARNDEARTIGVFEAPSVVVRRFVRSEKKEIVVVAESSPSVSSEASSIDSCREDVSKAIAGYDVPRDSWKATRSAAPSDPNKAGRQIFFRSGTLERLEAQRDEKLTGHIILLQARCRGYLARRKLNTLKLQDLAVRCIQRNVRKLMSVREWPWWRLYVKVAPLLNVHRTEDQLKARTEELEVLRAKVERLEQERNHLKHDNDKLEAKEPARHDELVRVELFHFLRSSIS